jgi:selenocysteine-specific elongation factor
VLRDTTSQRTLGGGKFLDLRPPARKRRTPERLAQLQAHAIADPQQALTASLEIAPHFIDLSAFGRDRALSAAQFDTIARNLGVVQAAAGDRVFALSAPVCARFKRSLLETLKAFHAANPDLAGVGLEKLRMQLEPRLPVKPFMSVLHALAAEREIGLDGAWVRLAGHEVRLTPHDERLWARIEPLIGGAERFRPPRVRDIAGMINVRELDVRRLLKLLARMGKADEVALDHFFRRATVAEMVDIIVDLGVALPEGFSAAQFRDRVDNGRKVAIQILEFFDRHGVTLRRGDLRRVNKHRLDLFRTVAAEPKLSGRESSPVGRPDFKSGRGREPVLGGFDSLSLPPDKRSA